MPNEYVEKILPPPQFMKMAENHWIAKREGQYSGSNSIIEIFVLQWNPGAQRWSHSGLVGTGMYVMLYDNFEWYAYCPLPEDNKVTK
jgi:hypothetical protein